MQFNNYTAQFTTETKHVATMSPHPLFSLCSSFLVSATSQHDIIIQYNHQLINQSIVELEEPTWLKHCNHKLNQCMRSAYNRGKTDLHCTIMNHCTAVLKKSSEKEELGKKQQDEGKIADEI